MSILRNRSQDGYTVITNNIFRDERLPINARGLLCTMLSLPDGWDFSEAGLCKIIPANGLTAIRTALKTLQNTGYLRRTQLRDDAGKIVDWLWEITNIPYEFGDENPKFENPKMGSIKLGNGTQLITKEEKTNESNTKEIKKERGEDQKTSQIEAILSDQSERLAESLREFVKHRREIKKPITPTALKKTISRLDSIASSEEEKIACIDQSIANGWTGVFPAKDWKPQIGQSDPDFDPHRQGWYATEAVNARAHKMMLAYAEESKKQRERNAARNH